MCLQYYFIALSSLAHYFFVASSAVLRSPALEALHAVWETECTSHSILEREMDCFVLSCCASLQRGLTVSAFACGSTPSSSLCFEHKLFAVCDTFESAHLGGARASSYSMYLQSKSVFLRPPFVSLSLQTMQTLLVWRSSM